MYYETPVYMAGEHCEEYFLNFLWFLVFYAGLNYFVFKVIWFSRIYSSFPSRPLNP